MSENDIMETDPLGSSIALNIKEIQNDPHVNEKLSLYSTFHGFDVLKSYPGEQIKVGLRVVRPQSWKPPSDYKFGNGREIGTIVNITESGDVTVHWDRGGHDNFEKGDNNQFDLLLFDNAQIGVKHTNIQCHGCGVHPLRGIRWKCKICRDYDLCTDCYMSNVHDHTHIFKRMVSTDSKGEQMPPRENQDFTRALGIQPKAYVHLHSDHKHGKHKGRVVKYLENDIETYRSDANVKWNDNLEGRYSVGRNGRCDLKCLDAAKGPMYYEDHLPIASFKNVQKGARVVRGPGWDDNNDQDGGHGFVGTVTHVGDFKAKENMSSIQEKAAKSKHMRRISTVDMLDVSVQWDNGNIEEYNLSSSSLRLFDNGPLGVEHKGHFCECCPHEEKNNIKKYIRGIRWKCITCHDFDLCNICYMSDKHDLGHTFQRCVAANLREDMQTSREHPRSTARQSYGIFKDAKVVQVSQEKGDEKEGIVMDIGDCKVDTGRSEVEVKWIKDGSTSSHQILDLRYDKGGAFYYYYDHLPALGRDSRGYFAVNFVSDCKAEKKISVNIWRTIKQVKKLTFKPSLYLIFANHIDVDKKGEQDDNMILMEEVLDFAKKTKLPCHVVGQKVLFHSGSINTVFIHYKTEKDTIKELVKKGFRTFDRGDIDENVEDEIHYFIRMAQYIKGEAVLPVLISFRNGGMRKEVMNSAAISKIPIIRLQKHSLDVSVLTADQRDKSTVQMTEHITDLKNPWSIKTSKQRAHKLGIHDGKDDLDEIALISQIQGNYCDNLDTLVCCLIIGVSMKEDSLNKKIFGVYTQEYPNALSMYLLKEGKWKIPKEFIKASFSHRSIEYIYEEDMTSEIKNGLWSHLKSMTNMAYEAPDFQEKEQDDAKGDDKSSTDSSSSDDENKLRSKIAKRFFKKAKQKKKRLKIELDVSTSELYGLILYALLKKQYWNGAQQLIETGCIRIRQILIGCVLLEEEIKNWRTSPHLKEKLQRFKSAITQRAIRITSCICVADRKTRENSMKIKDNKLHDHDDDSEHKEEKELGEHINHAGRLLVNHGYIEDAIKTQNKTFLDNSTVKNILNEMWYGTEKLNFRTSLCFFGLAVVHLIVLPLLMISMEEGPLIWFYKKYKLPFMKVLLHMLGFLTLNTAYAYMLLFDYSSDGFTYTDYFIIVWMVSFFVDESKQQFVSIIRKKWKGYAKDLWNILDWLSMIVYAIGMILKLGQESQFRNASKVLLVTAFILLSIRILNLFCMSAILGPKLVMIRKMARDTVSFMMIMVVIMMCYNISFYALLYPNSEFSWLQIEKIIQNGYWMLFGELNLDSDSLSEPHCTFNRTVYESTDIERCPEMLGVYIAPYLKALYGLIAVILLLNLLIAMYSDTFQKVHQESEFYWAQIQTDFLEDYSIKTVFPLHLQLLVLPAAIIHAILWFSGQRYKKCRGLDCGNRSKSTLNHRPMFVRVFLYNTNFDLKLKTTKEAEGSGALHAKGEIDLTEVDRITMLQQQMDNNSNKQDRQNEKQDKQNEKNGKRNKKIIGSLHHINKKLSKIARSIQNIEELTDDEDDHHHFRFSSSSEDESDSQSVSSEEHVRHTRRPNLHWL